MIQYRTKEGDVLDAICYKYYGRLDDTVEKVLEANPGLAAHGTILPPNLLIKLPELVKPEDKSIRLWD